MAIFEGRYDFPVVGVFDGRFKTIASILKTAEYATIAQPFAISLRRIGYLYELPLQLLYWAEITTQIVMLARHRRGLDPDDVSRDEDQEHNEECKKIFDELTKDCTFQNISTLGGFRLSVMLGDLSISAGVDPAKEGIEAALAAMVMSSYAAFETLAADLWIAAVNRHSMLAANWIDKNSERQLPASVIAGYNFNVSNKMGSVLQDTKKVAFEFLYDIRGNYSDAFKGAIDVAFEPFEELQKAEKTRHLFAHRGGLIDRKFKDDMAKFPEYINAEIGDRLRLTGPVTRNHIDACAKAGCELLIAVDNWTLNNQ